MEDPTTRDENEQAGDAPEGAEEGRLQDLEMSDEEGRAIKGGVPKQPDAPEM